MTDDRDAGAVRSSAMRLGLLFGVVGVVGFGALTVLGVLVDAAWWAWVVPLALVVLGVIAVWQGLTASVVFDAAGVRARPWPWRRIALRWDEVESFRSGRRGLFAVTRSGTRVFLLEFGRYRRQVEEREASLRLLEAARGHSLTSFDASV